MRNCHRLLAIIEQRGSAEALELCELLALADWIAAPMPPERSDAWARDIAVPLIAELGRRLQQQRASQEVDLPAFFSQVHAMRRAQKTGDRQQSKASLESQVDRVLSAHFQPSLFG